MGLQWNCDKANKPAVDSNNGFKILFAHQPVQNKNNVRRRSKNKDTH
jgi:hypothetical protein